MNKDQKFSITSLERFMDLYKCNARSYGTWNPKTRAMLTVKNLPIPREAYASHLNGHVGLGGVPIIDDNTCWWGAIDIDTHGNNAQDVDIPKIAAAIEKLRLPALVCRSKSGGAHVYTFFTEPAPCAAVRPLLARWAAQLGFPSAEIFPKQSTLDQALDGSQPLGSWINLPYFNAPGSDRYCVVGGKKIELDYFLDLAEGYKFKFEKDTALDAQYIDGPPCLQEMLNVKVESGSRNTALFQASVFLKRAYPDEWKDKVREFNAVALLEPLNARELRQITGSVTKREYQYKCREEPCKSLCNREVCKTREHGITDIDEKANELPPFDKIEKVISTPVRWILHIKGQQVELDSIALFDFGRVRTAVYEKLNLLLPRMKNDEWDTYLREIASRAELRHETTLEDVIYTKLCDFLRRAQQDKTVPEDDRRHALLRRMPALISVAAGAKFKPRGQVDEKGALVTQGVEWFYAFRAQDFIDNMRRHRALLVQEHQVHTILHKVLGKESQRDKFQVQERTVRNVWLVPERQVATETVPDKKFITEY